MQNNSCTSNTISFEQFEKKMNPGFKNQQPLDRIDKSPSQISNNFRKNRSKKNLRVMNHNQKIKRNSCYKSKKSCVNDKISSQRNMNEFMKKQKNVNSTKRGYSFEPKNKRKAKSRKVSANNFKKYPNIYEQRKLEIKKKREKQKKLFQEYTFPNQSTKHRVKKPSKSSLSEYIDFSSMNGSSFGVQTQNFSSLNMKNNQMPFFEDKNEHLKNFKSKSIHSNFSGNEMGIKNSFKDIINENKKMLDKQKSYFSEISTLNNYVYTNHSNFSKKASQINESCLFEYIDQSPKKEIQFNQFAKNSNLEIASKNNLKNKIKEKHKNILKSIEEHFSSQKNSSKKKNTNFKNHDIIFPDFSMDETKLEESLNFYNEVNNSKFSGENQEFDEHNKENYEPNDYLINLKETLNNLKNQSESDEFKKNENFVKNLNKNSVEMKNNFTPKNFYNPPINHLNIGIQFDPSFSVQNNLSGFHPNNDTPTKNDLKIEIFKKTPFKIQKDQHYSFSSSRKKQKSCSTKLLEDSFIIEESKNLIQGKELTDYLINYLNDSSIPLIERQKFKNDILGKIKLLNPSIKKDMKIIEKIPYQEIVESITEIISSKKNSVKNSSKKKY